MTDKKGDENEMINKKETSKVITASDDKVMKVAKEQFKKYRETFKKLAKN